jgi:mannosyltransferase OCH1-like enzyme
MNKNIFQTHKSVNYINSKPKLVKAMTSWLKYSNTFNYMFYNNTMCDDFIKNNFDEKIYKAYSMLPIAVMKADLWRYCVIYKYGGIYADTDTVYPNNAKGDKLRTITRFYKITRLF